MFSISVFNHGSLLQGLPHCSRAHSGGEAHETPPLIREHLCARGHGSGATCSLHVHGVPRV